MPSYALPAPACASLCIRGPAALPFCNPLQPWANNHPCFTCCCCCSPNVVKQGVVQRAFSLPFSPFIKGAPAASAFQQPFYVLPEENSTAVYSSAAVAAARFRALPTPGSNASTSNKSNSSSSSSNGSSSSSAAGKAWQAPDIPAWVYSVPGEEHHTSFWVKLGAIGAAQTLAPPVVRCSDTSVAEPLLVGPFRFGGDVTHLPEPLTVAHGCKRPGRVLVTVTVVPHPYLQPYRSLTFTYAKRCGGVAQGLQLYKGVSTCLYPTPSPLLYRTA